MSGDIAGEKVDCCQHGVQGIGLMCVHVARALDSGDACGFHWSEAEGMARPDAWCGACELRLRSEGWSEAWFADADFKIVCAACWDLAKHGLEGGPSRGM